MSALDPSAPGLPIAPGGGGGASIPVSDPADLLAGATASLIMGTDSGGDGALVTADAVVWANRRPAATANTRLLWECDGTSGAVANTGSLGASGNLTAGGALVRNNISLVSTLGAGIYCDGTSTGQAVGAVGVIPTGASSSITAWVSAVVPSGWTGNQTLLARDYAASGWAPPYIGIMLSLRGGTRAVAHVNGGGTYASADIALAASSGQLLIGLTYDGTTLSLWADGVLRGTAGASGAIDWGTAGKWHLGANESGEYFTGTILRAGVEQGVWDAARWRQETLRARGNWIAP